MSGEYFEDGRISDVTVRLIQSFIEVTTEQVNQCYQKMFTQQRRVNIKLVSQNHMFKDEADEESEGLGGQEFKDQKDTCKVKNDEYYGKLGLKQKSIDNIKVFQMGQKRYSSWKK